MIAARAQASELVVDPATTPGHRELDPDRAADRLLAGVHGIVLVAIDDYAAGGIRPARRLAMLIGLRSAGRVAA
jgi:hypothetical protein